MKRLKKERYNLDSDDEEDQLTHGGVSLGDAIDFAGEDIMSDDEEDHKRAMSNADIAAMNFGGGALAPNEGEEGGEERTRTRKEIMEEVIAKSKKFKAERQKAAQEDEAAVSKLDEDWSTIKNLVKHRSNKGYKKEEDQKEKEAQERFEAQAAALRRGGTAALKSIKSTQKLVDDFDEAAKALAFDAKAKPTDRKKTEEEVAAAEAERLTQLEIERQRRMRGEDAEEAAPVKRSEDPTRRRTDDDLEDDFDLGLETDVALDGEGGGTGAELEEAEKELYEDEEDEEDDEEEGEGEEGAAATEHFPREGEDCESSEGEGEDDGEDDSEAEEDEVGGEALEEDDDLEEEEEDDDEGEILEPQEEALEDDKTPLAEQLAAGGELPYTYRMPGSYADFAELIADLTEEQQATVIRRIIVCHSVKIKAENRAKSERFYAMLVKHLRVSALQDPIPIGIINTITKELFALSPTLDDGVPPVYQKRLAIMDDTLTRSLATGADGAQLASKWPSRGDLFFFQLTGTVFPVTDHRHTVVTPMLVFMARTLSHCPVFTMGDILAGAFTSSLLTGFLKASERFCPEVWPFLLGLLDAGTGPADATVLPRFHPIRGALKPSKSPCNLKPKKVSMSQVGLTDTEQPNDDQTKVSVAALLLKLIEAQLDACAKLQSAPELATMTLQTLANAKSRLPKHVQAVCEAVSAKAVAVRDDGVGSRKPLEWQTPKPKSIRLMNPRFDEHFNPDRSSDPVKERAEEKKSKQRMKREVKHAKRELHQDSVALAEVRDRKRGLRDTVQQAKMHKHLAELEAQQNNFKETGGIMNDKGKDKPKPQRAGMKGKK